MKPLNQQERGEGTGEGMSMGRGCPWAPTTCAVPHGGEGMSRPAMLMTRRHEAGEVMAEPVFTCHPSQVPVHPAF